MKNIKKSRIQLAALVLALFSAIGLFILFVQYPNSFIGHLYIWSSIEILIIVSSMLVYRMPLSSGVILLLIGLFFFGTGYMTVMPGLPLLAAGGLAIWVCSIDSAANN